VSDPTRVTKRIPLHAHTHPNNGGAIGTSAIFGSAGGAGSTSAGTVLAIDVTLADIAAHFAAGNVEAAFAELFDLFLTTTAGGGDVLSAHGTMGATETFAPASGNWHTGTFDAACTFTFTAPTSGRGCTLFLELAQDGTGGWAMTLPASFTNKAALEAAQITTASTTAFLIAWTRDGGTTWYGQWVGAGGLSAADFATPAIVLGTAAAAGVATTAIRSDSTIVAFNATVPVTQAFGDAAGAGSAAVTARRDHRHGMPATPTAVGDQHLHVTDEQFNGDASTTVFVLANSAWPDSVMAWIAGARTPVTLGGSMFDEVTFGSPPGSGTNNVSIDYAAVSV